jgi:hypothetical protein
VAGSTRRDAAGAAGLAGATRLGACGLNGGGGDEPPYRFVDWFASTEALKISIVQSKDSVMPARRSLLDSAEFLTYSVPEVTSANINRLWADELKAGRVKVHPAHPRLGEVVAAVSAEQPALVAGERTAREAMARLVPVVNAVLGAT